MSGNNIIILLKHIKARCYVYIDDVVISARFHDENLKTLQNVFSRFRQHNLKAKPQKCHIGTGSISYLGYEICSEQGIKPGQLIWSEWRLTVIAATVRIALVDILDLSEVDIPAGVFLHPAVGWG